MKKGMETAEVLNLIVKELEADNDDQAERLFEEFLNSHTFNSVSFTVRRFGVKAASDELFKWLGVESFCGPCAFDPDADTYQFIDGHDDPPALLGQTWTVDTVKACITQQFDGFVVCESLVDFMRGWSLSFDNQWANPDEECNEDYSVEVWVCDDWKESCRLVKQRVRAVAVEEFDGEWKALSDQPEHFDGWTVAAEGRNKFYIPSPTAERIGEIEARRRFYEAQAALGVKKLTREDALKFWLSERGLDDD